MDRLDGASEVEGRAARLCQKRCEGERGGRGDHFDVELAERGIGEGLEERVASPACSEHDEALLGGGMGGRCFCRIASTSCREQNCDGTMA